ncbi:MAG: PTS sugar transporter subunit IIA [Erysipelotrichaceae bacterium]|nr:PTS sugar transporter subunit IIA [Erysipelotrichaceae bacterium]
MINLVNEKLILLNQDAKDWKDAIKKACEPLLNEGKIKETYVDGIIENVIKSGPYIVIAPHVAIPHTHPDKGVIENAIGICVLKNPIKFGNEANDPVKYLFTLAAISGNKHIESLSSLALLLEDEKFYKVLDNSKDSKDVMLFLQEYERNKGNV